MADAAKAPSPPAEKPAAPTVVDHCDILEVRPPSLVLCPLSLGPAPALSPSPGPRGRRRLPRLPRAQEDDEFEEFEQQEWTPGNEDIEDPGMWQDGWEDDVQDDNFTFQLRAELAQTAPEAAAAAAAPMAP